MSLCKSQVVPLESESQRTNSYNLYVSTFFEIHVEIGNQLEFVAPTP